MIVSRAQKRLDRANSGAEVGMRSEVGALALSKPRGDVSRVFAALQGFKMTKRGLKMSKDT